MPDLRQRPVTDQAAIAAMAACVKHARDLVASAIAVQAAGHPHIAYHLAALALEEVGRRELIGVQRVVSQAAVPPEWPAKHAQDHVKKLFWCFFGGNFFADKITGESLEEITGLARRIHDNRLMGLYVEHGENGLIIPSETITKEQAQELVSLADAIPFHPPEGSVFVE